MILVIDNTTCEDIVFRTGGVSYPLDRLCYGDDVVWERKTYESQYFTIESQVDGNTITLTRGTRDITYSASRDGGNTWTSYINTTQRFYNMNNGDKIMFRATTTDGWNNWTFSSTGNYKVYGNIMSLLYGNNFVGQTALRATSYEFCNLFRNSVYLTDAKNLILPATTLVTDCYQQMFYGCTSLTTAPELPAIALATRCYAQMFSGCTSLTEAPVLPAERLGDSCYQFMFYGCTSLTTAPELPAIMLSSYCYSNMFYGCTSLMTAPVLPAETLVSNCYYQMFYGCSSLNYIKCLATHISATNCTANWVDGVAATGTFGKSSTMTGWTTGVNGIPRGWTVQDYQDRDQYYFTIESQVDGNTITFTKGSNASDINYSISRDGNTWTSYSDTQSFSLDNGEKIMFKATTSNSWRYWRFSSTGNYKVYGNIMSLLYGDDFVGQIVLPSTYQFYGLFQSSHLTDVANLVLPATTLTNYCYSYMFSGCTSLTDVVNLVLPATTLTNYCYSYMFSGCTSLITTPNLGARTLASGCYQGMFYNCTSLISAYSRLPATTLVTSCYSNMFYGCTSLMTAPVLPAETLVSNCYYQMFRYCEKLNYIKAMFITTPGTSYTSNWVYGVASTGTFVRREDSYWSVTGVNGIPSGWTVKKESS